MSRAPWVAPVLAALAAGLLVVGSGLRGQAEDPFPHENHDGLFPLCTGCHGGVETGDASAFYPEPELCARCHDGVDEEEVEWQGPGQPVGNLAFVHTAHEGAVADAGDDPLTCETCHGIVGGPEGAVARSPVDSCLSCHAHESAQHYEQAECATCHVPLAETAFSVGRIEALPVPEDHEMEDFLALSHGGLAEDQGARCATCHTRDLCAACHVDATRTAIVALPPAPASMELPPVTVSYPEPESHEEAAWVEAHGADASLVDDCSTCHTQTDCASCHLAPLPAAVEALPLAAAVAAPGVELEARAPTSHVSPFFMADHEALASGDQANCGTCHEESYCASCHDGPTSGGFHPPNFQVSHPAEAYANRMECSTCHNTTVFCRQCHVDQGMGSSGRLGPGFHDAEPVWLLRHGEAARQNLESCASCHTQNNCLQCHSTTGAFQVNPHGPGFDADRARDKNPVVCFACHAGGPPNGGGP